jgi:hypothetical protein
MPSNVIIGDVYIPPLFAAAVLALLASSLTAQFMNRRRLTAYFVNPPLVFVSMVIIYTVIFGSTIFPT